MKSWERRLTDWLVEGRAQTIQDLRAQLPEIAALAIEYIKARMAHEVNRNKTTRKDEVRRVWTEEYRKTRHEQSKAYGKLKRAVDAYTVKEETLNGREHPE